MLGTIPANTGRIWRRLWIRVRFGDHPREYGENALIKARGDAVWGRSPRIRGEFFPKPGFTFRIGTIPANTGRM